MKLYLIVFLKALAIRLPTPNGVHHNFTYKRVKHEGIEEDRLILSVWYFGEWHRLYLDDNDCSATPEEMVDGVMEVLTNDVQSNLPN